MNATRLIGTTLAGLVVLTACVTINVYFPAAAAEKAADAIIEEIWGTETADEEQDDAPSRGARGGAGRSRW